METPLYPFRTGAPAVSSRCQLASHNWRRERGPEGTEERRTQRTNPRRCDWKSTHDRVHRLLTRRASLWGWQRTSGQISPTLTSAMPRTQRRDGMGAGRCLCPEGRRPLSARSTAPAATSSAPGYTLPSGWGPLISPTVGRPMGDGSNPSEDGGHWRSFHASFRVKTSR
jgi:hypothetical protein